MISPVWMKRTRTQAKGGGCGRAVTRLAVAAAFVGCGDAVFDETVQGQVWQQSLPVPARCVLRGYLWPARTRMQCSGRDGRETSAGCGG